MDSERSCIYVCTEPVCARLCVSIGCRTQLGDVLPEGRSMGARMRGAGSGEEHGSSAELSQDRGHFAGVAQA